MAKKLILGLILACLTQIWAASIFFSKIWLRQALDIMVSYHHVRSEIQYQKYIIK